MNIFLKTLLIYLFGVVKRLFLFASNPQNFNTITTQLMLISEGAKILGVSTQYERFADVANKSITIAKTVQKIIDGFPVNKQAEFIKGININQDKLKDVQIGIHPDDGIKVNFQGIEGSYNPSNGSVKFSTSN
jgi:hypothetical protein